MISPDIQRLPIPILKKIVADLSLKDLDSLIEVGGNFGRVARSEKQRRELEGEMAEFLSLMGEYAESLE